MEERLKDHQEIFRNWIRYRKQNIEFPVNFEVRSREYEKYIEFYSTQYDIVSLRDVPLADKNIIFLTFRSSKAV